MSLTIGMVGHMVFGGAGLIAGFSAFIAKKGSPNHILIGRIYVIAMLLMAATGFYYAYVRSVHITMLAASLTVYFVVTSWLVVQRTFNQPWVSRFLPTIIGLPIVTYALLLSWHRLNGITDQLGSFIVPAIKYYEFTAIICIGFVFDLLVMYGRINSPKDRINQHIWRMAFTLYVACSAFFEGQARIFPESLRYSIWLHIPETMALLVMAYWLCKDRIVRMIKTVKLSVG